MEYTQFIDGIVKAFVPDIHIKYILIQNLVENTKMRNVDIILENFLQKGP